MPTVPSLSPERSPGVAQMHRVVLEGRTLAHHPSPDTALAQRAQHLDVRECRFAQRDVPALPGRTVLDSAEVDVEPPQRFAAEPGLDGVQHAMKVLEAVGAAPIAGVMMREIDAGMEARNHLAPGQGFLERADLRRAPGQLGANVDRDAALPQPRDHAAERAPDP